MSSYDANILNKEAGRILGRANNIVALYALAGFFFGLIVGAGGAAFASKAGSEMAMFGGAAAFAATWVVFFAIGYEKSWSLRVQAHRLYWMVDVQLRLVGIQSGLQQRQALQAAHAPSSGHRATRNTPPHGHTAVDTDRHR